MNRLTEERREADGDRYSYDVVGNRIRKQHYNFTLTAKGNPVSYPDEDAAGHTINTENGYIIDGEEENYYNERNQLTERKTLSGMPYMPYAVPIF